jgi:hypothetical protein
VYKIPPQYFAPFNLKIFTQKHNHSIKMTTQSEHALEEQVIAKLQSLGYAYVALRTETDLQDNLKRQLEIHNRVTFSTNEFEKVLHILQKGTVFEKAKTLRDKQHILRDNGENLYFEFLNTEHWCQNQYQVAQQISVAGKFKNRYDVTLLINGLPLVQIELKRRGIELKEAFNQPLPTPFLRRKHGTFSVHPNIHHQQWGEYQILREQSRAEFQTNLLLDRCRQSPPDEYPQWFCRCLFRALPPQQNDLPICRSKRSPTATDGAAPLPILRRRSHD